MVNLSRMRTLIALEQRLQFDKLKKLAKATKITTTITGMPRGSGTGDKVADGAMELAEVEEAYQDVISELETMRNELKDMIRSLDDPDDSGVIHLRYVSGMKLAEIPYAIHLSERAMFYHLASAERKLTRMFPDRISLR